MLMPEDPQKVQEESRQKVADNLRDIYSAIERLIQKSYQQKEMDQNFQLRSFRSDISGLLPEVEDKNLGKLAGRKGNLEDFYVAEDMLLASSFELLDFANSCLISDSIDIVLLESYLNRFEQSINGRVIIDKGILNEFKLKKMEYDAGLKVDFDKKSLHNVHAADNTINREEVKTQESSYEDNSSITPTLSNDINEGLESELDTGTLSKMYNYFNILEHKYSSYQPEVSYDGSYIGDVKWVFDVSDMYVFAEVRKRFFKTSLTFETYWHPFDDLKSIIQFVQQEANSVPKEQYKSICVVNSIWPSDMQEWVASYMHPRLILFLYELDNDALYFNKSVKSANYLAIWHNSEEKPETIEDKLNSLLDEMEYFVASDLMRITGLNSKSADKLIKEMVKNNKIIDIGFGSSKYTRPKE
jgi:hypothetical protein